MAYQYNALEDTFDNNGSGASGLSSALNSGYIFVGNGSNVATGVPMSGDISIDNTGLTAIGSGKVTNTMLAGSIAYSKLTLTGAILNADLAGSIAASKLIGSDIATVGTITSGTWNGTVISSTYGGTGVNNAGRTLTISANNGTLSFTSAVTLTIAATASISGTNTGDNTVATSITSRTLWGQTYDGTGNVSGSLTAVGSITGGASSMTILAGTGASRTLTFQTTTAGSTATTALTLNADQTSTFAANISGTGAWTITGGAGNMTIVSGTGNSRTMILQTTTSGGTATTALTLNADQSATFAGAMTATSHNGLIITTTLGTLTIPNNASASLITSGNFGLTLTATATTNSTFPSGTDTLGGLGTIQTWTALNTFKQINWTNNAITASGNAATVPITHRLQTVTNNSAATLTITLTTTSAVDGQLVIVRILDSSAAAQTITWVNTENSTVTAPTTSNGSTTLFLTVGFIYNGGTSKWRCIASA